MDNAGEVNEIGKCSHLVQYLLVGRFIDEGQNATAETLNLPQNQLTNVVPLSGSPEAELVLIGPMEQRGSHP